MNLSLAMVLSLERLVRELSVGGATQLLVQLVHSAQDMESSSLAMSWVLSELLRLRFWHSHEETIETVLQTGGSR